MHIRVPCFLALISVVIFLSSCKKEGCTDPWADNYDFNAKTDDGSCYYSGCTDRNADNYDPDATIDDGSCYYSGCTNPLASNYDSNADFSDGSCMFNVLYTIECLDCSITYENSSGGVSQESSVNSSWSYSFTGSSGTFIYLSAQNNNDVGTVTVNILLGANTYKTSSSSGAYVIATVSDLLPD